jgi:hypothetical protein
MSETRATEPLKIDLFRRRPMRLCERLMRGGNANRPKATIPAATAMNFSLSVPQRFDICLIKTPHFNGDQNFHPCSQTSNAI